MFSKQMRQNNNQQQNSQSKCLLHLIPVHETSMSKKVLELQIQIHNTQKCYQSTKRPIKYFSKLKRSFINSKNAHSNLQPGILSQKIIPPNIGQNLQYAQKPTILQNTRLKNVFQAYKQTLQQKYRKRMRQMQKTALKINTSKIYQNQLASQQIINQKESQIKKRLSNKKFDPNILSPHQNSSSNRQSLLRSLRPKQTSSRLLQTIDDSCHNFVRSTNKKSEHKITLPNQHFSSNQQVHLYQVKRKCYTQERQNQSFIAQDFNKTRNISFKLPHQRRKTPKHFMQKIGGLTYDLPQIRDKLNVPNETISYLVKSLKKPSMSQNYSREQKFINSNISINEMPIIQQSVPKLTIKQRQKRHHTLQVCNQTSIFTQCSIQNENNKTEHQQNMIQTRLKQSSTKGRMKYQIKQRRTKKKLNKYNILGDIQGWDNTQNQIAGIQNHFFHSTYESNNDIVNNQEQQ